MTQNITTHLQGASLERGGRTVLHGIQWSIRPGERWVLLGGNGAGKSQLLKVLAGDVWPTPTERATRLYRWRNETFRAPYGVKDEIAYVGAERQDKYERYGWDQQVEQIIGTGLYRTDIPRDALTARDRQRIEAILAKFNITALARRNFLGLSYGERRIVLLARALATRPKLLLLDEPFNGLDEQQRARVLNWLEGLSGGALPWVLATHRGEDVPKVATHVAILEAGRLVDKRRVTRARLTQYFGRALRRPKRHRGEPSQSLPLAPPALLVRLSNASVHLDTTRILRNLSFELRAGECWVVHGPNGSGKSTLLRAIYGEHAFGNIERAGIEPGVPLEHFRKRAGWIAPHLQASHPQNLTVMEVVQSGRYASIGLNDAPTAADRAAARRALDSFGLTQLAGRELHELSYGQLRRVLFARAWVREPRLLLLDEPFAGVDAPTCAVLLERIDRSIEKGVAVMLATHHENEWPRGATHEIALREGRATYCGRIRHGATAYPT